MKATNGWEFVFFATCSGHHVVDVLDIVGRGFHQCDGFSGGFIFCADDDVVV